MAESLRVAVIGHTGRGNYGHGLDTVWPAVPGVQIVGVADTDPQGLAKAVARLKAPKGFADYRKMLDELKPDLVAVAPRWLDQHRDMVVAAAERGARGIYMEKPFCRTPAEADQIIAACRKHGTRLAIAHQTRYSPKLAVIWELIHAGKIGQVLEFRARGKEDSRGGGEDLWVLGSHVLNLIHCLGGEPQWCFATVAQEGRPIGPADAQPGNEGIGLLAGDEVHAFYRLAGGAVACFDSKRRTGSNPSRFGLCIYGTEGVIEMSTGYLGPAFFLPDPSWSPGKTGKAWIPISSAGVGVPEPLADTGLHGGNLLAVADLIQAVESGREPEASVYEARMTIEMITAVFASQCAGGPVKIPLASRGNPLETLKS